MQHTGPNARRAGVGLLHVASEMAISTGRVRCVGGGAVGEEFGGVVDEAIVMMANGRCCWCSGELAGASCPAREVRGGLRRGRRGVAAAGPGEVVGGGEVGE